ncbi:oligosaccharide flippase family protein [Latilactobacillus sakei]|uniref:oligosaccharide flippase family protein n=1 Tax=Latilactobacillus sakei TaxID=1599 RepID=UPI000C128770|nr:oligosaccharide flippase family protein [Latilactobacillus sakei]PKX61535.1 teichoic acid transporter [Latilactobacillus sakei]PKX70205.1 teichoic acid transporter [Latilactobacillus sakei]RFN57317.1 teichoic acid transporter [Latilactobacillus sakei]UNC16899.1 oligosaccharide flippase family protein [Latilactobacillus sakei]SON69869.1 Membrane protein [Latilactobacillus sakei]
MNKTIKNIIYNGLYQLLIIALPILTIPYVARVLGANGIGTNSYVASIGNILSTIIVLGINQFGVRIIARTEKKPEILKRQFFSLWIFQLIMGVVVVALYTIFFYFSDNQIYLYANIPYLIGFAMDISWFFIGIEQIKEVVLRNTIIKLTSLAFIFLLVRTPEDLITYILINSLTILFSNVIFWKRLYSYFGDLKIPIKKISFSYFVPLLLLGAPQIAVQLYTNFDSTTVGLIAGSVQLAYYDQSQKIVRIILALVTSVSTVLMPKLAQIDKDDEKGKNDFNRLIKLSLDITLVASLFLVLNLMINSNEFVPWFFGNQFRPMIKNMYFVSLILVLISYGGVFSGQFALAKGYYKEYSIPYFVGAAVSLPLNIFLVSKYQANGGTLAIIITEFFVCMVRIFVVRKKIDMHYMVKGQLKYILVTVACIITASFYKFNMGNPVLTMVLNTMSYSLVFFIFILLFNLKRIKLYLQIRKRDN